MMNRKQQALSAILAVGLLVSVPLSYADSNQAFLKAEKVTEAVRVNADFTISGAFVEIKDNQLEFVDVFNNKFSVNLGKMNNLKGFKALNLKKGDAIQVKCNPGGGIVQAGEATLATDATVTLKKSTSSSMVVGSSVLVVEAKEGFVPEGITATVASTASAVAIPITQMAISANVAFPLEAVQSISFGDKVFGFSK